MRTLTAALTVACCLALPTGSRADIFVATAARTLSLEFPTLGVTFTDLDQAASAVVSRPDGTQALTFLTLTGSNYIVASTPVTALGSLTVAMSASFGQSWGSFSGTASASFGGLSPLFGTLRICLLGTDCTDSLVKALVPLSVVGGGGSTVVTVAGANVTITGNPWTTASTAISYNTVTVSGATTPATTHRNGFGAGPGSLPSTVAQTSGRVQLVSPLKISADSGLFGGADIPGFAVLDIHFIGDFPPTTTSTVPTTTTTTTTTTAPPTTTTTTTTTAPPTTTTTTTTTTIPSPKVAVCHVSLDEGPPKSKTIRVSRNALVAHLAHGDSLGACP